MGGNTQFTFRGLPIPELGVHPPIAVHMGWSLLPRTPTMVHSPSGRGIGDEGLGVVGCGAIGPRWLEKPRLARLRHRAMKAMHAGHSNSGRSRGGFVVAALGMLLCSCSALAPSATLTPTASSSPTMEATASPTTRTPSPEAPSATASPSPPPRYNVEGEVRLWLSWTPDELRSLEYVIQAFREQYPGVSVHVAYYPPDQILAAFEGAAEQGRAVSLLLGPAEWGPSLWEGGLVRDLSVRITSDLHESIHPLAWSQVAYRGAIVGLPLELQGIVLYRNRALVRSPVTTLQEMVSTARDLQASEVVEGAAMDMGFMYAASQIAPCGGDISFELDVPVLTADSGLCWLSLLSDLSGAGPVTFDSDADREMFIAGRAAWYWDSTELARELDRELGVGNLVIDPWLRDEERGVDLAGFVWSENIYFPSSTSAQETEAAWVFASYLLTQQAQATLADVHGAAHLPVLNDARLGTDLQQGAMRSLLRGVPYPLEPRHLRYMGQIEDAARMVTEGRGEPEFALAVAFEGVEGLFPTPTPEASPSPGP